MTRYDGIPGEGTKRGRILDVKEYNWFHGHWNNNAGVAHYERYTAQKDGTSNVFDRAKNG